MFGMQINVDEYWCTNDRLHPKGICSGSSDLFTFWEI